MALTQVNAGLIDSTSQPNSFKNRIINGAMMIDQRNAGASFVSNNGYSVDRWSVQGSQGSKLTVQQNKGSVTPPAGFANYLGVSVSTTATVGAGDYFLVGQPIEGYNVADLSWGTANAAPVTLSFKVYSSETGTFGGVLTNAAQNRSYPFTYTVSSANTWTTATITVVGDTSGTWGATNGTGILLYFGLGVGSTYSGTAGAWAGATYLSATGAKNIMATSGATFYITGVQLEKGSTATSFDYRPYGTELALCQRYYEKVAGSQYSMLVGGYGGSELNFYFSFLVSKRASPTMTEVGTWVTSNISARGFTGQDTRGFSYYMVPSSSARTYIYNSNSGAEWTASSEL